MQQPTQDNDGINMLRGASLGAIIGLPVGLGIAWLAGMLDGWNWPFVVFQSSLVFAMTMAWTAPLYMTSGSEENENETPGGESAPLHERD